MTALDRAADRARDLARGLAYPLAIARAAREYGRAAGDVARVLGARRSRRSLPPSPAMPSTTPWYLTD